MELAFSQNPRKSPRSWEQLDTSLSPTDAYLARSHLDGMVCFLHLHEAALGVSAKVQVLPLVLCRECWCFPLAPRRQTRYPLPPPPLFSKKTFPGLPSVPHSKWWLVFFNPSLSLSPSFGPILMCEGLEEGPSVFWLTTCRVYFTGGDNPTTHQILLLTSCKLSHWTFPRWCEILSLSLSQSSS